MDVVAEGIEDEAQRSALMRLGCEYGQGWLFGRPMSEAALRVARSVPAWWPIDRGRALFRALWVLTIAALAVILLIAVRAALVA